MQFLSGHTGVILCLHSADNQARGQPAMEQTSRGPQAGQLARSLSDSQEANQGQGE